MTAPLTPAARVRRVIRAACVVSGIPAPHVIGQSRKRQYVAARHFAIAAVARRYPDMSLNAIARHFGGRNHATILHALRKMHGPDYSHRPHARIGGKP